MAIERYYLGMPFWGLKDWVGNLYADGTRPADFLEQYAQVFNAVEGNTTFYHLPDAATVQRWKDQTPESFRFSFKFPQEVTHKLALRNAGAIVATFLRTLAPLGTRLGPFMLQLPPRFGPSQLGQLDQFLSELPDGLPVAVELRHPALCAGEGERRANDLMAGHGVDRVLMDTRPMRSGDPSHRDVVEAAHQKPDLPVHRVVTGNTPFARVVGHPDPIVNEPWLQRWAMHLAEWIEEGRTPYFYAHVPNNLHAPPMARRLHALIGEHTGVGTLPEFPGEMREADGQMRLL